MHSRCKAHAFADYGGVDERARPDLWILLRALLILVCPDHGDISEINAENCNDFAPFETATEILRAMSDHENLAATEFYDNLEEVRRCLNKDRDSPLYRGSVANEMAFLAQGMEVFLALPDVDFGPFDPSGMPINLADAVHSWSNYSLWSA